MAIFTTTILWKLFHVFSNDICSYYDDSIIYQTYVSEICPYRNEKLTYIVLINI